MLSYSFGRLIGEAFTRHPRLFNAAFLALVLAILGAIAFGLVNGSDQGNPPLERQTAAPPKADPLATPSTLPDVMAGQEQMARQRVLDKFNAQIFVMSWSEVCARWGHQRRHARNSDFTAALERYVVVQKLANAADVSGVDSKRPSTGMSGCGVLAILGTPDKTNNSASTTSTSVQWVYRDKDIYVYTRGPAGDHRGIVESVSY